MKILITGGCGFLGTNLSDKILKQQSAELFILDNFHREGSLKNLHWLRKKGRFTLLKQDIRDSGAVMKSIKKIKPDAIFHLAGQVAMTSSIENPRNDFEINVLGTINILESVRKHSPHSIIVYSSSNKVYGDLEWVKFKETDKRYFAKEFPYGFPENIQLNFHSPYGCSKGAADQYVLDYHRIYGLNTVVFRHSTMYGGRQFSTYDQGWVGWFCEMAQKVKNNMSGAPFTISGNGKQVRDVLHAQDMINLYLTAVKNIKKISGEAFNIGGGMSNSLSLLELFDILENELKIKLKYERLPWRQSDQKVFVADISKYTNATGWTPKIDKLNGIKRMLTWVSEI